MRALRLELCKRTEKSFWKESLEIKETDSDLHITLTKSFPTTKDLFEGEVPCIFDVERIYVCHLDAFNKLITYSITLNDVRLLKRTFTSLIYEGGRGKCYLGDETYRWHRSEAVWTYTFSASKDVVKTLLPEKLPSTDLTGVISVCDSWSFPDSWGI